MELTKEEAKFLYSVLHRTLVQENLTPTMKREEKDMLIKLCVRCSTTANVDRFNQKERR